MRLVAFTYIGWHSLEEPVLVNLDAIQWVSERKTSDGKGTLRVLHLNGYSINVRESFPKIRELCWRIDS